MTVVDITLGSAICGRHRWYQAKRRPTLPCGDCWEAYWREHPDEVSGRDMELITMLSDAGWEGDVWVDQDGFAVKCDERYAARFGPMMPMADAVEIIVGITGGKR